MDPNKNSNQRLSKFLAYAGIASRRNSEKLILAGRITVNGLVVTNLATKVSEEDYICFDKIHLKHQLQEPKIWIYHKPVGEICSDFDPSGKRTVFNSFPDSLGRVCLVGRLDYNSEGLLVLTNKGFIKRYLELPKNRVKRTYAVKVWGKALNNEVLEPLREGVKVSGITYAPMIVNLGPKGVKGKWLEITLTEGKNREIRKALEKIGLQVSKLKRIKYGYFTLEKLFPGQIKEVRIPKALSKDIEKLID
ncbi:MAG: pseudouridine synthase [Paracoccaceae bacterium]